MELSLDFGIPKNDFFETNKNNLLNKTAQNKKAKNDIVVVKKGEAGYIESMDEDRDGEISLEEFNKYCEENGVDEKHKLALLETIQSSKLSQQISEKTEKQQEKTEEKEEETPSEEKNQIIYARKGDEKYNEAMDENKNDIVTYEEYMKYCAKREEANKNNKTKNSSSKAQEEYSKSNDDSSNEPEFSIETEA